MKKRKGRNQLPFSCSGSKGPTMLSVNNKLKGRVHHDIKEQFPKQIDFKIGRSEVHNPGEVRVYMY